MARMKAMEVPQRVGSDTAEPIGPLPPSTRPGSGGGGGGSENKATRKVSFRVRGAGRRRREGRSSALRQSTVAALTSKFNALTESSQRLVIHEDTKGRGGGRYSVVLEPRSHPALVARLSAGGNNAPATVTTTTASLGGVKAAIQIFEKNVVQSGPHSEPVITQRNLKNVITASKNNKTSSIILTTKGKNLTSKKIEINVNDIVKQEVKKSVLDNNKSLFLKKTLEHVVDKDKSVPIPPKPGSKPVLTVQSVTINRTKDKSVPLPPKPELKPVNKVSSLEVPVLPPKNELKPLTVFKPVNSIEKRVPSPPHPEHKPQSPAVLKKAVSVERIVPTPPKSESKPSMGQSVSVPEKTVPPPPKPELKPNVSSLYLPLIKAPKPPVQSAKPEVIKSESAKNLKPEVPVKNQHIIKEYLENTENNKNKPLIKAETKPNKSSLFLPLIKPILKSPAQSNPPSPTENDERSTTEDLLATESRKSPLKPPDSSPNMSEMVRELNQAFRRSRTDLTELEDDDETPTQETSLVAEVLNALAENKILSPLVSNSGTNNEESPETPKVVQPNTSFLWSSGLTQCKDKQSDELEDYDDVYVSARNSYAALRLATLTLPRVPVTDLDEEEEEGNYEYCGPATNATADYDEGAANLIYDDVKSLAATSNCYESIGSCAPSYCEKNNSLYGIPEDMRGSNSVSSSGCSLESNSPRVASRASTISAEEGPHEVLSYQLLDALRGASGSSEAPTTPGERPSEAGSDEWVDIELSESEEQLGPPVDIQETILIVRERSRTKRSPSWSHKVRRQWSRSPKKRANMPCAQDSTSSDSDHHYETLYEAVGEHGGPGAGDVSTLKPAHTPAPPPPLDEDEACDSDTDTDTSFDSLSVNSEELPPIKPHAQVIGPRGAELPPDLPELPPPPPGAKKINKIAEAAGKKMRNIRKNLTLRKKDLSDRLRRLSVTNPIVPSPTEPLPPTPPASAPSLLEKSVSTGNLNGRKYWSFKRQSSSPMLKNGVQERSIFYVSQSDEQPDTDLGDRDNPHRRSTTDSVCSSGRGSSASSEVETAPRRLSRTTVRPKTPPPPPPTERLSQSSHLAELKNAKNGKAPWYADMEISSLEAHKNGGSSESVSKNGHSIEGDLSWYSEIGLDNSVTYSQNGGSIADSSHTTESSESSNSPDGSVVHGCFADEPLYQFYNASVLEQANRDLNESDSDGYEEIGESGRVQMVTRPSAMELIRPREGHRTLWCEVPDVIESGILATLNQQERKLQEAKFEVITSEASYVKSLNILATHFVQCPEFQDESIISKTDKHILFSNILPVKACSERFLAELERCWQDSIMLPDICEVVYRHATKHFRVYVKYCSHQIYLDRTLRKLKENSAAFSESLARLEAAPECQSLSLHSFLMLPMQRVTRLPLLLDAVIRRLSARDAEAEYNACKMALFAVNKVVEECNEGARCMERMEEMLLLSRQLEFRDVRAVPLISSTRWLVRSGELTQLTWRDEAKLTFGRRFGKLPVCVFLFTDLLIVAKRKGEESYQVLDYCARNLVQVSCPDDGGEGALTQLPVRLSQADSGKNLLLLTLLQNHESRTVEMVLSCALESDRQRWLAAFTPIAVPENPEERVYEEWDCPQVQAVHAYTARQPDELSLEVADVVNVLRKLPDGWYQGERIRDGERGWFPGNYCKEVLSSHVRARNLRQRYRLLALSREYIERQQRAMQEQRKARRSNKPKTTAVSPAS